MKAPTLALSLFVLCGSGAARADEDEARAWFVKAQTDYDQKRYPQALEALRRAYDLRRLPLLLRYIGDCHFAQAQHQQAVKRYRDYLARVPDAADRARLEQRIAESEAALKTTRQREYQGGKVPLRLMPTGKDRENPLKPKAPVAGRSDLSRRDGDRTWPTVSKWTALGLALGGLAMGVTFNRLAASKAEDLRQSMRTDCPPSNAGCPGNPNLDRPVVSYSLHHYEMQRQLKRRNTIAVASFVVGGVAASASAMLFWIDRARQKEQRRGRRVSLAPVLGSGSYGLAGQVSF